MQLAKYIKYENTGGSAVFKAHTRHSALEVLTTTALYKFTYLLTYLHIKNRHLLP